MNTSLLSTKFNVPPSSEKLVVRQRLLEKLSEGFRQESMLTLVCAPAGYGKTTLVSSWIQGLGIRREDQSDVIIERPDPVKVAWLTLDTGDNDLTRFLAYLITAFQGFQLDLGTGMQALMQSGRPQDHRKMATWLINDLEKIVSPFVLVLDDFHLITASSVLDFLSFFIEHKPSQMCLVVVSRADPPFPLARLRARGQLTEIRQRDLCFTLEETAAFIKDVMGVNLTPDQLATLEARTEGWAASLQLVGISLRKTGDVASFIQDFSGGHEHIADYLTDEILDQQPQALIDFLLETSILDRLSAPLCEAVTGIGKAGQILEKLRKENLFLVPLDQYKTWYRYHPLFSDLLRKRLNQDLEKTINELHRRASVWYEESGFLAAAIEHALEGNDFERAANLIEQVGERIIKGNENATMLRWIETIPLEHKRDHPILFVYHGFIQILSGKPPQNTIHYIDEITASGGQEKIRGEIATFRGLVAVMQGDADGTIKFSKEALTHLSSNQTFFGSLAADSMGMAYALLGDIENAAVSFQLVVEISEQAGNLMMEIMALSNLAGLEVLRGRLRAAADSYHRVIKIADEYLGKQSPEQGKALMGLGMLAREWNDLEGALGYFEEAVEMVAESVEIGLPIAYLSIAAVHTSKGDWKEAQASIDQARWLSRSSTATTLDDMLTEESQARLWLAQGKLDLVKEWLQLKGFLDDILLESLTMEDAQAMAGILANQGKYLLTARLFLADERPKKALEILDPLFKLFSDKGHMRRVIEILALKALAVMQLGNEDTAIQILDQALVIAEPEGYRRTFLDEGQPMAALLYLSAAKGKHPSYAGKLLGDLSKESSNLPSEYMKIETSERLIEPLSERELEVLTLIADGLSNQEIAERLYLSLSTVKSHTSHIYSKLNVRKRTQAVSRARTLGLLPIL